MLILPIYTKFCKVVAISFDLCYNMVDVCFFVVKSFPHFPHSLLEMLEFTICTINFGFFSYNA